MDSGEKIAAEIPFNSSKTKITIAELNLFFENTNSSLRAETDGYDSMLIA